MHACSTFISITRFLELHFMAIYPRHLRRQGLASAFGL